jgi:hypothetical protein
MAMKVRSGKRKNASAKGTMDMTEHLRAWNRFVTGVRLSGAGIIIILVLLAIFRTN